MEKKINYCGNCPFFVIEYDDFAVDESITQSCNLAKFEKKEDYFLDIFLELNTDLESPEWCPLKKEQYSFKFKKFSTERVNEINSVKAEVEKLEMYFDEREYNHTDTIKDDEYVKKDKELKELYLKLNNLHENEELTFYQDEIKDGIMEKINEIKDQLEDLENAGTALQDAFSKLGNI